MYDELVNALRRLSDWSVMDFEDNLSYANQIAEEAADAIEELQKAVNFHKFNSEFWEDKYNTLADEKWISVTERLPKPNAEDEHGFAKGYLVKTDRHVMMHTARYTGIWWVLWGKAEVITDTVTHWMPLPTPPTAEEGET